MLIGSRARTGLGLLLLAVLLAVAGCTSADPEPDPVSLQRPAVGECKIYDRDAAEAPVEDTSPVDCAEPHTAETIAVTDSLPEPSADGTWTDTQLQVAARLGCNEVIRARVLRVSALELSTTRLGMMFFAPSAPQARAGARWLRCDTVVLDDGDPVLVTGRMNKLLTTPGAFALCTTRPPADAFTAVRCDAEGQAGLGAPLWVAAAAVALPDPEDVLLGEQPGRTELTQTCTTRAAAASDQDRPRTLTTFPTEGVLGDDIARCWLRLDDWRLRAEASWPDETPLGPLVTV